MRRAVRSPVLLEAHRAHQLVGMQAALHQELALGPRGSARPPCAAAASLWGASTISKRPMSSSCSRATAAIFAAGPTRIGAMMPASPPRPRRAARSRRRDAPRPSSPRAPPWPARSAARIWRAAACAVEPRTMRRYRLCPTRSHQLLRCRCMAPDALCVRTWPVDSLCRSAQRRAGRARRASTPNRRAICASRFAVLARQLAARASTSRDQVERLLPLALHRPAASREWPRAPLPDRSAA